MIKTKITKHPSTSLRATVKLSVVEGFLNNSTLFD
jgi:hypothetical protein